MQWLVIAELWENISRLAPSSGPRTSSHHRLLISAARHLKVEFPELSWCSVMTCQDQEKQLSLILALVCTTRHLSLLLPAQMKVFQNHPFYLVIKDLTLMNSLSIHSVAWLSSSSTSAPCPWWSRAAIQSIKDETSCSSSTINDGCFMWGQKLREIHTDRQTESWEM